MTLGRLTLRTALPAVLLAALVGLLLIIHADSLRAGRATALAHARYDLVNLAEALARSAAQDLREHPDHVAGDVGMATTDIRLAQLAVVGDDDAVLLAHRQAWRGRPVSEVVQGWQAERGRTARLALQPDLREFEGGRRVAVLLSFPMGNDGSQLRDLRQGLVYAEFALDHEYARVAHEARIRVLPLLAVSVALMLGLGWVLRRVVTIPLAQLEEAAQRLASGDDATQRVPEQGPREVTRLAQSFNRMTVQVQDARRQMANHQARLEAVFDSAMDAIIIIGTGHDIRRVNTAALQMFRTEEAALLGQPITVLLPERFRAGHAAHVEAFAASGVTSRAMGRQSVIHGRRLDGQEFPVEASISHLRVDGEDLFTVILRDVTERQRAEAEVQALNARLESLVEQRTARLQEATASLEAERHNLLRTSAELTAIFDTATIGILLLRQRHVVRCNAEAEKIFGWPPGGMTGQPTRPWFADEASYAQLGLQLYADVGTGQLHRREQAFLRRDGTPFWARISAQMYARGLPDEGLLAVVEDITHEHEVAEALRQAKDMAEQASRAKSAFLANMSHEIRTPMNAIIGMTHLAQKTALDDKQRDYLDKIQQSSQHLLGIINDILDFSKIEADRLELEAIDFQLTSVLDSFATLIAEKAASKGLELIFDVARDVPNNLVGDPLRLGQVLINYGNNAVKFTQQGEVSVRVRVAEAGADAVLLRFDVRDTGIGLHPEQLPQLFQSFQQGDNSTSRQFGGTGLGLAIVRRLAELMGGEVGASSEPGRGANFWFTARLGLGDPGQPLITRAELRNRRLLIVDDNDTARAVLADVLEGLGFEAGSCDSGPAALAALAQADQQGRPYDLALIDWQMPGMDGLETGQQVHALGLARPPHLMLVTGFGREEVLQQALQQRFEAVLVKPINASVLLDHLLAVLTGGPARSRPDTAPAAAPSTALSHLRGARVLVVDDNAINQQIASELLRDAGLVVEVCSDGRQALQAVQARPYDLVLMDMHMPVLDGLAATRAIRALPALQTLPIVAMTANVLPADRERCHVAGMNDFLSKPIDPDRLYAIAAHWVKPAAVRVPSPLAPRHADDTADAQHQLSLDQLRDAPGLDVANGLRRSGHKPGLYLSLLGQFADSQRHTARDMAQAVAQGRTDEARRLAHTLKGVAGNLGAVALQEQAVQLEHRLDHGSADALAPALTELQRQLSALLARLDRVLPPPATAAAAALDPAQLASLAPLLREQLQAGLPEVRLTLASHERLLQALLGDGHAAFTQAVRHFDFEAALALIEPALQRALPPTPPAP